MMFNYTLENNFEYLTNEYLDKIDDCIINLYDTKNKYDNYVLKYNNEFAVARLLIKKTSSTLVFFTSNINNLFMQEETKKLINYIYNTFNLDISILLLNTQIEYINFFKSIGFIQNIIYRDYILINNQYYDILSYTLYRE